MALDEAVSLVDVDVCRGEKCPGCDPQEKCVLAAVSTRATGAAPFLYINQQGGDLDQWSDGVTLTNWTNATEDASAVLCLGDFILVVSNGAGGAYYTDDLGATLVEHVETDWGTNGPNDVDGMDQSFVVMVNNAGRVWGSYDAARTWEILDDGIAESTQNLSKVMIARDNPQVIYAIGVSNALIKTENGGINWFALTGPSAADALTALWVKDQFHVLIGNDDGEIHESSDGGETWTQQDTLPSLPLAPIVKEIKGCGCDGMFAVVAHTGGTGHRLYRNVDGGASGKWFIPTNMPVPSKQPEAAACCDINTAVVVGGNGVTGGIVLLIA